MKLPPPALDGDVSLERTIKNRRTIRSFYSDKLSLKQLSQLLWSAQGITDERGLKRAAASGGALYPMDIYAAVGREGVEDLKEGVYAYKPEGHEVTLLSQGDLRRELAQASLGQMWMAEAPLSIVIAAEYRRICGRYGERGVRYAIMEFGHIAQNVFLQAEALGLGAGIVGAFHDERVSSVLNTPEGHEPLLIMPVGYKR